MPTKSLFEIELIERIILEEHYGVRLWTKQRATESVFNLRL